MENFQSIMEPSKNLSKDPFGLAASGSENRVLQALQESARKIEKNLFETSDKIIQREKDNAKNALDELWILKRNSKSEDASTIDLLIAYYQNKLDTVRQKEQQLKKTNKESLKLLEERKAKSIESGEIVRHLKEIRQEITFLQAKREKLEDKEREIKFLEDELNEKLVTNESVVLEDLLEIIIPHSKDEKQDTRGFKKMLEQTQLTPPEEAKEETPSPAKQSVSKEPSVLSKTAVEEAKTAEKEAMEETEKKIVFPKSIVKTERGRILGEYYYHSRVYKNERHYILNGNFLIQQIRSACIRYSETKETKYMQEVLTIITDTANRIHKFDNIHYERATNEILNEKLLTQLASDVRAKNISAIFDVVSSYDGKIKKLGPNYDHLLSEQLNSYHEKK